MVAAEKVIGANNRSMRGLVKCSKRLVIDFSTTSLFVE